MIFFVFYPYGKKNNKHVATALHTWSKIQPTYIICIMYTVSLIFPSIYQQVEGKENLLIDTRGPHIVTGLIEDRSAVSINKRLRKNGVESYVRKLDSWTISYRWCISAKNKYCFFSLAAWFLSHECTNVMGIIAKNRCCVRHHPLKIKDIWHHQMCPVTWPKPYSIRGRKSSISSL